MAEARVEDQIAALEHRIRETAEELGALRRRLRPAVRARAEAAEIRDAWDGLSGRWRFALLAGLVAFVLAGYLFYMNLGWYADQRSLPPSSDWLLDRLPLFNLVFMLSWGWLALHAFAAGAAALYEPRRLPFLLFLLGIYLFVRTVFVFLSPIGAPVAILDMREFDALFAAVAGEYTFQNEFIFSGHTAVPFLFALFFRRPAHRAVMFAGSLAMAVSVLVTRNHYTVDVISAYLVGYAIFALSAALWDRLAAWLRGEGVALSPSGDAAAG